MNTLQNLIDNGIEINTAIRMLSEYQKRIGTTNGIYYIKDINYDFNQRGRDVALECTNCGKIIHRMMICGRNKWSELIKTCDCQKIEKENEKIRVLKNSEKIKKALILSRIGQVFGDYRIDSVEDLEDTPKYTMHCTQCGADKIVSAESFDKRKNFHCTKHYVQPVKFDESYIGMKNNFLTVRGISKFPNGHRAFVCECDCGNVKLIEPFQWKHGNVKSCGCKHNELNRISSTKHGHSGDRLYKVYRNMVSRCYCKNSQSYHNYGGRGIKICDKWTGKHGFENFYDWSMKNGYDYNADFGQCTIDRMDVDGDYCPDNCRWTDLKTQANNKRPRNEWKQRELKTWTIGDITKPRKEWCIMYGIGLETVLYRINHKGMTVYEALTSPKVTNGRPRKEV